MTLDISKCDDQILANILDLLVSMKTHLLESVHLDLPDEAGDKTRVFRCSGLPGGIAHVSL